MRIASVRVARQMIRHETDLRLRERGVVGAVLHDAWRLTTKSSIGSLAISYETHGFAPQPRDRFAVSRTPPEFPGELTRRALITQLNK